MMPAQHPGEAPHQGREPPATNSRPVARQTVAAPAPEAEAARGRAMEAAMQAVFSVSVRNTLVTSVTLRRLKG
jgi:hypothetical protein